MCESYLIEILLVVNFLALSLNEIQGHNIFVSGGNNERLNGEMRLVDFAILS